MQQRGRVVIDSTSISEHRVLCLFLGETDPGWTGTEYIIWCEKWNNEGLHRLSWDHRGSAGHQLHRKGISQRSFEGRERPDSLGMFYLPFLGNLRFLVNIHLSEFETPDWIFRDGSWVVNSLKTDWVTYYFIFPTGSNSTVPCSLRPLWGHFRRHFYSDLIL